MKILNVFFDSIYLKDNITIFRFISKKQEVVDIDRYELSKNILYKVSYQGSLDTIPHCKEIINDYLIGKTFIFNNKYRLIFDKNRFNNRIDTDSSINIVKNKCHVKYLVNDIEKATRAIKSLQNLVFSDFFERFYIKRVDKMEITRKNYISIILEFENGKHNLKLNEKINNWFLENKINGLNTIVLADKDKLKIWGDINLIEIPDFEEIKIKRYSSGIISDNRNFFYVTGRMFPVTDENIPGFYYTSTAQMQERTIRWFYNEKFCDFTEGEAAYIEDVASIFNRNSTSFLINYLLNIDVLSEFLTRESNQKIKYTKLSFDLEQNDLTLVNVLFDFNFWGLDKNDVKNLIYQELNEKLVLEEINTFENKIRYNMFFRKIDFTLYKSNLLISFLVEPINFNYDLPF